MQQGKVPVEEWFRGIASNGNKFVCVGQGQNVLTSSDGIQWEEQKNKEFMDYFDYIIWNGKIFVAVGRYGSLATSPDGVKWNFGELPAGGTDGGLWDGERFVFVGEYNDIFITKDFRNYNKFSYGSLVNSIVWNGERYVMVGDSAEITTWIPNDIIKVKVNNSPVVFDVAPKVINGRTLLPIRAVTEKMGATLNWDSKTQTVEVTKNKTVIKLTIGRDTASVNGKIVKLDSPARVIDGRTLIPLRFVAENLGANVTWDNATQTVLVEQ